MSDYTVGEIAVWLVLTAVLAFVLGWLVRELQVRAGRRRAPRPAMKAAPTPDPTDVPAPEEVPAPEPETAPEPKPEPAPEPKPEPQPAKKATPSARRGVEPPSADHVIKGNTSSKIYHLPDSSSYARTKAGVWFRTEAEAEEAGFRKAGAGRRGGKKAQAPQGSVPKKQPGKPSDG